MIRAWLDRAHARTSGWTHIKAHRMWVKDDRCITHEHGCFWLKRPGTPEVYAPTLRKAMEAAQ